MVGGEEEVAVILLDVVDQGAGAQQRAAVGVHADRADLVLPAVGLGAGDVDVARALLGDGGVVLEHVTVAAADMGQDQHWPELDQGRNVELDHGALSRNDR